ncbi:MAG: molybdenum cofactor guanylyltransferase [bacterium]|nr:molybdenum cofactor guanylyltransferase [bacterium]
MAQIPSVSAAILIGGESQRMGQDKASLIWQGISLLQRVVDVISPLVHEVLVVVRPDRKEWAEELAPSNVRVICDRADARGPLAGIHAALDEAICERVLVTAVDMPFLQTSLLEGLMADESAEVVVPRTKHGFEPLLAVYSQSCLPAIAKVLTVGPSRIPAFYSDVSVSIWDENRIRDLDPGLLSFENFNHPEDLEY